MKQRLLLMRTCLPLPLIMSVVGFAAMAHAEAPSSYVARRDPSPPSQPPAAVVAEPPAYVARREPAGPEFDAKTLEQIGKMERRLAAAEKTLGTVEERLGRTIQPPTPTRNFERRMDDLERRLAVIERDQKQLDNRVRKLEAKR